ncbi:MAG: methyltransferase domain-containing protein [Cycloclasticus sp.]|nr:methyltransferase domain-containing protein [Cycloclasticus sp.]
MSDLQHKWDKIYSQRTATKPEPATMLSHYSHLLPKQGIALDLACGLGGNAFFLDQMGMDVDAWDISPIAIKHINQHKAASSTINALAVNINGITFPKNHYDVIAVSRFLDRQLIKKIISALKPQGLLFYQTFTHEKAQQGGPNNPRFLLQKGELLALFSKLSPIIYHEEGCLGDTNKGIRNEAILIAQKRSILKPTPN